MHPDDYESIQASIDAQIADPDNHNLDYVEYRIVRRDGAVRELPVSGDRVRYDEILRLERNVTEMLNRWVLALQYDMVSYIVGDNDGVVIGDSADIKRGNIFPKRRDGVNSEFINSQVIPAASPAVHNPEQLRRTLAAETVVKALEQNDAYTVDATCEDGGEFIGIRKERLALQTVLLWHCTSLWSIASRFFWHDDTDNLVHKRFIKMHQFLYYSQIRYRQV